MSAAVAAGAGFLLAVLWFDLMFDVQMLRRRSAPGEAVDSIAAYYRRVTTDANPMSLLVAAVMAGLLTAIVVQIAGDDDPDWVAWTSLALAGGAIATAALHTFPTAVRLGARLDPPHVQGRLARAILRDHLVCFPAITAVLVMRLGFAG